jgi:hypothetical protein
LAGKNPEQQLGASPGIIEREGEDHVDRDFLKGVPPGQIHEPEE